MYAEPPSNTKFKPGQSGNPNGRPKKLDEHDMLHTLQQIIALYSKATSVDKTISHPANHKIQELKDILKL